jgi:hypothetical protein
MKYKISLGILELIRTTCWMVMGVLLVNYFDVDITSKLELLRGA